MAGYALYITIALVSCFVAFSIRDREGNELANRIRLSIIFWILFLASALRIYTGNEIMYFSGAIDMLENGDILTMCDSQRVRGAVSTFAK